MGIFKSRKKKQALERVESQESITRGSSNEVVVKGLTIHPDLIGLVWIGDGKYKNYTQPPEMGNTIEVGGLRVTITFGSQEEPSLVYTKLKVGNPKNLSDVERPPYYPTYSGLSPEQKWVYLNLLANPYNPAIDIGFVFILYYGLERHLLNGNFEDAIKVILKLRDVHTNKSFQSYSANAVVLSCMLHKRGDLVLDFIKSLDKEHELEFSDNLFLICYYSFDLPLYPKDIIRMARTFEFTNRNYIKKYPDIFSEVLKGKIQEKLGCDSVDLKKYLTQSELNKAKSVNVGIFANMSIGDESIPVPFLAESFRLKREMYNLLEATHEEVKKKLAEMRKAGKSLPVSNTSPKTKKVIVFDNKLEKELLKSIDKSKRNPVDRHFNYIGLQDFYYKFRSLGDEYIEECIRYCLLDINSLQEMQKAYITQEIDRAKQLASITGNENIKHEIEEIKKKGFYGNIPAFKRLVIIYEKMSRSDEAIDICDRAIEYGQSVSDFESKKEKIQSKRGK